MKISGFTMVRNAEKYYFPIKASIESILPIVEAAPNTRFYYYHIPFLSGVLIDPMKFTDLSMDRLPTFCGIKYSDAGTLHNLPLLQKIGPKLEFFGGSDEGYLQSLAQGYDACVGSTYNFAAPIYRRVREAFEAGDMDAARLWQGRAMQMLDAMFSTCGRACWRLRCCASMVYASARRRRGCRRSRGLPACSGAGATVRARRVGPR